MPYAYCTEGKCACSATSCGNTTGKGVRCQEVQIPDGDYSEFEIESVYDVDGDVAILIRVWIINERGTVCSKKDCLGEAVLQ
jgi:hypothetical protein